MTSEEQDALQYRFSGYQLPLLQMDETGPAYVVLDPHPYYRNQPTYWQKNAFKGSTLGTTEIVGGDIKIDGGPGTSVSPSGENLPLIDF